MTEVVELCDYCKVGFHAPFERFERVAVFPDGPTFLKRCGICGAHWHESLHSATLVDRSEAVALYGQEATWRRT